MKNFQDRGTVHVLARDTHHVDVVMTNENERHSANSAHRASINKLVAHNLGTESLSDSATARKQKEIRDEITG